MSEAGNSMDKFYKGMSVISVDQFNRDSLDVLFERARAMRDGAVRRQTGKVLAVLFYEASTRTDMSFQSAMLRLGGSVMAASNGVKFSSALKGETLSDTVRSVGCLVDVVVLRHPDRAAIGDAVRALGYICEDNPSIPVINGGNGDGEHPTQALLDLFTMLEYYDGLDGKTITFAGDLKYGRTVHSLARLLARYGGEDVRVILASPMGLEAPAEIVSVLDGAGFDVEVMHEATMVTAVGTDIMYWTRVQRERMTAEAYKFVKDRFVMTPDVLIRMPQDGILMHPLPRADDMSPPGEERRQLDANHRSVYFEQVRNGLYVRMALLDLILGG